MSIKTRIPILLFMLSVAYAQPDCRNACATNLSLTHYGFTFPINKWLEYCSLTPVPGLGGGACAQLSTFEAYQACVAEFCPFLPPAMNKQCGYCLADVRPGEPLLSRIFRCSATFIEEDAAACRPPSLLQVRYAANLDRADSLINITNTGAHGSSPFGPGIGSPQGNVCANVYAFSPDEQMIGCCSCLVTPNALVSLSVVEDIRSVSLTGVTPNSMVIKLLATGAGANFAGGNCIGSAAAPGSETFPLAIGVAAWSSTAHVPGASPVPGAPNPFAITESPFTNVFLSPAELTSLGNRCTAILGNGSTYGTCKSCRTGALGASRQ